jgi:hypothetical protein
MILQPQFVMPSPTASAPSGNQIFHDFSGDPLEQFPSWAIAHWGSPDSGWRVLESSVDVDLSVDFGDHSLFMSSNDNNYSRRGFEIENVAGSASDEIASCVHNAGDSLAIPLLILRGAGASTSVRSGYVLLVRSGTNNFEIRRTSSGVESTVASATLAAGSSFMVSFSSVESGASVELSASAYPIGNQADEVTLSYTDNSPLPEGWPGFGSMSAATSSARVRFGYIGVGTVGSSAPTTPL